MECYACGVQLKDWREGQNPRQRHVESVEACPLKDLLATSISSSVDDDTESNNSGSSIHVNRSAPNDPHPDQTSGNNAEA